VAGQTLAAHEKPEPRFESVAARRCRSDPVVAHVVEGGRMVRMADSGHLRVGDAERETYAARVRDAYVEGRLNHEELDTRLDAIHAAVTRADLVATGADLPVVKSKRRRSLVPWSYLEANAVLWGIWGVQVALHGSPNDLWPLVVTVPWGALEAVGILRRVSRRRAARSVLELTSG
jgi:hypothetical protein